jgi:iron-sulfur cluster assembly accessory protein
VEGAEGCAGFQYTLGFDDTKCEAADQVFQSQGLKIVCDPKSFLYLNGIEIDFEEGLMGRGFKFNNPNATGGSCGCGESFGV